MCFRPAQIEMKTCPQCGKVNKPIAEVCEACGAELPDNQGTTIDDPGSFNAANEAPIAPGSPKPPGAPQAPAAPPKPPQGF